MQHPNIRKFSRTILALSLFAFSGISTSGAMADPSSKIDPQLLNATAKAAGLLEALIEVKGGADKNVLNPRQHYLDRRHAWVNHLQASTTKAQTNLIHWLERNQIEHKSFWINNTIFIRADLATLNTLAARDDVVFIFGNPSMPLRRPLIEPSLVGEEAEAGQRTLAGVEWGVMKINAPKVWAAGITGQGVTIAGEDTGYQWNHPAIKSKYRGWNGSTANHNYNWYDATRTGSASCAPNQTTPCDDDGHGTHTIGTMVGDDGAGNQIGVAPGAKWIGCRNMIGGAGTPATYTACLQWLVAPTDVSGQNPDPSKAPDISSHSWGCPPSEGCTASDSLKTAVQNVVNAGIMVIAAAGNDGASCSTISDPPGKLDASFTIGSTTSTDAMSSFSSRGPVVGALTNKPDVSAPGSSVRSAWLNNGFNTISGTSMATPHVAGTAALLIAANPALRGQPSQIAAILRASAVTTVTNTQVCGGIPATTFPNPVVGAGRIDAYAAYLRAISAPVPLANGVAQINQSGALSSEQHYSLAVPAGATSLRFATTSGSGNIGMYVRFGSKASNTVFDCKSEASGTAQVCNIPSAQAGSYFVMLKGISAFSGVSLTGSYSTTANTPPVANFTFTTSGLVANFTDTSTDAGGSIASRSWNFGNSSFSDLANPSKTYATAGTYNVTLTVTDNGGATATKTQAVTVGAASGTVLTNGVAKTNLSAALNATQSFTMVVPAGATSLKFVTSGGTGDADLYVKFGSAPTTTTFDCRSERSTNAETCSITTAKAGTYYVLIKAYKAYSGLSLTGSFIAPKTSAK
jgi:serine protease AprX